MTEIQSFPGLALFFNAWPLLNPEKLLLGPFFLMPVLGCGSGRSRGCDREESETEEVGDIVSTKGPAESSAESCWFPNGAVDAVSLLVDGTFASERSVESSMSVD